MRRARTVGSMRQRHSLAFTPPLNVRRRREPAVNMLAWLENDEINGHFNRVHHKRQRHDLFRLLADTSFSW